MPEARPYFEFGTIAFRPVAESDLELIRRLRNDGSTWANLGDPRPLSEADQKSWLAGLGLRSGKFYFMAMDPPSQWVLGLIRMDEYDPLNRSIRVGADVVPELRGKGFGSRIYTAIKKYCFDILNVHRIWLAVLENNEVALKLYAKTGFSREGCYRSAIYRDGKYLDYVLMSLLESEYRLHEANGAVADTLRAADQPPVALDVYRLPPEVQVKMLAMVPVTSFLNCRRGSHGRVFQGVPEPTCDGIVTGPENALYCNKCGLLHRTLLSGGVLHYGLHP